MRHLKVGYVLFAMAAVVLIAGSAVAQGKGNGNGNGGGNNGGGGNGNGGSGGGDHSPPAAVTDLAIVAATHNALSCSWTATGDDGSTGTAAEYDIRFMLGAPITEANWDTAWRAFDEPVPSSAGSVDNFVLPRLASNTTHYIAIRVVDDAGNSSELSNIAVMTTSTLPAGAWETARRSGCRASSRFWHGL